MTTNKQWPSCSRWRRYFDFDNLINEDKFGAVDPREFDYELIHGRLHDFGPLRVLVCQVGSKTLAQIPIVERDDRPTDSTPIFAWGVAPTVQPLGWDADQVAALDAIVMRDVWLDSGGDSWKPPIQSSQVQNVSKKPTRKPTDL